MSIVTITLNNKNFKLSCPEDSKEQLVLLSEKLDFELEEIQKNNPSASFELLLVITALGLIGDKQFKAKETGGEVLEKANQDFQKQLSSIFSELKILANKFE